MINHGQIPNKLSQSTKIIVPADDNSLNDINGHDESLEIENSYRSSVVNLKHSAENSGDFDESFTRESRHSYTEPSMQFGSQEDDEFGNDYEDDTETLSIGKKLSKSKKGKKKVTKQQSSKNVMCADKACCVTF